MIFWFLKTYPYKDFYITKGVLFLSVSRCTELTYTKVYNKVYNIFIFVFLKGYRFYIDTFRFFITINRFYCCSKYTLVWSHTFRFSDFCIKKILSTYKIWDLNPYISIKKGMITSIIPMFLRWWSWRGSNSRPPPCHGGALPVELQPQKDKPFQALFILLFFQTSVNLFLNFQ